MFSRDKQKAIESMAADLPAKMVDIPAPKSRMSKTNMPSIVSEGLHIAGATLRISFGPSTSEADIERFLAEWSRIAARAQAA